MHHFTWFGTHQWAQMPNQQLGIKSFCRLYLHLRSSVEKSKTSFFRVPTQKQSQLMWLLPRQATWSQCMDGQALPQQGWELQGIRSSPVGSRAICVARMGTSAATVARLIPCKGRGPTDRRKPLLQISSSTAKWRCSHQVLPFLRQYSLF